MIKRLLAAAFLVLMASPAGASMNIRQNGDGTADWTGAKPDSANQCVGGQLLPVPIANLSKNQNAYISSDITNAVVKDFFLVTNGTTTGGGQIRVYANQTASPVQWVGNGTTKTSDAILYVNSQTPGSIVGLSAFSVVGARRMGTNTLQAKQYIAVTVKPPDSSSASATVMVRVCPR